MTFRDTDPMWRPPTSLDGTNPRYPLALEAGASRRRAYHTLRGLGNADPRQLRRFEAQVTVLPLDGGLRALTGMANEVEHLGLFVHTRTTLPVGTLVRLRLACELGQCSFTAKVVQSVERYGIGCAFVDLDDRDRAILSLIVAAANSAPKHVRTITDECAPTWRGVTLH